MSKVLNLGGKSTFWVNNYLMMAHLNNNQNNNLLYYLYTVWTLQNLIPDIMKIVSYRNYLITLLYKNICINYHGTRELMKLVDLSRYKFLINQLMTWESHRNTYLCNNMCQCFIPVFALISYVMMEWSMSLIMKVWCSKLNCTHVIK